MSAPSERSAEVPLSKGAQRTNIAVFAGCTALTYLGAPALYVGALHAGIGNWLQLSATESNFPGSIVFFMTFVPVLVAWQSPGVSVLRRNMVCSYLAMTIVLAITAAAMQSSLPAGGKFAFVVLQAAVCGAGSPTAMALLWEMIGRGVDERRRGLTLALGFGVGPLYAVTGSYIQTRLVGGEFWQFLYDAIGATISAINEPGTFDWSRLPELALDRAVYAGLEAPLGFSWLFAMGAACMALAALLSSLAIVPRDDGDQRVPAGEPSDLARLVVRFLQDRTLALAGLATILLYTGNLIVSNLTLYSEHALGADPSQYGGPFNMLRFGAKFVAGLCLGWLLAKTNARAGMLATGSLYLLSLFLAIVATGPAYNASAALFGAGELIGVYAPNYILSASNKANVRGNMAIVQLAMMPTSLFGPLFGFVADHYGFRQSFVTCGVFVLAGLAIVLFCLPAKPRPAEEADR